MKPKKIIFIAAFTAAVLISSCAPRPVYKVEPDEKIARIYNGRKILGEEIDSIKAMINFERTDGGSFVFYIYFYNGSEEKIRVEPADIYSENYGDYSYLGKKKDETLLINVIDPEKHLDQIDKQINSAEANLAAAHTTSCIFSGADLLSDIVSAGERKTMDEIEEREREREERRINEKLEQERYRDEIEALNAGKSYWMNETLRLTVLRPGEETGGIIYLPFNAKTDRFRIIIPLSDKNFRFKFLQIKKDFQD